jgi:hypothetical protein
MTVYVPPAIDTQVDPPPFVDRPDASVPPADLSRLLRERDALAAEVSRLRREGEQAQLLRRQLEEARARVARGGGVTTREVLELRESVEQREQEVRRLKEANIARERLLIETREKLDVVMHEKAAVEGRLATRDRAYAEHDSRMAALQGELLAERRRGEEARQALTALQAQLATAEMEREAAREGGRAGAEFARREAQATEEALQRTHAMALARLQSEHAAWRAEAEATREALTRQLEAQRLELQAELVVVREQAQVRVAALDEVHARALAVQCAETGGHAARVAELQAALAGALRALERAHGQRDRMARQLGQALRRAAAAGDRSEVAAAAPVVEALRALAQQVGELTWHLVVQGVQLSAVTHQRARPEAFDVDEAISLVAEQLPAEQAATLWEQRDVLVDRLCHGAVT